MRYFIFHFIFKMSRKCVNTVDNVGYVCDKVNFFISETCDYSPWRQHISTISTVRYKIKRGIWWHIFAVNHFQWIRVCICVSVCFSKNVTVIAVHHYQDMIKPTDHVSVVLYNGSLSPWRVKWRDRTASATWEVPPETTCLFFYPTRPVQSGARWRHGQWSRDMAWMFTVRS